ncbi:glycosyltransferase family 2 protein [Ectothiorhodospira shaposhnikovii]|uniref:glycosyltransferase family 2 protein n=1 Tax=Ectothiorhodospira shaposhnikovii TaxID=1054 RepID=UPI00399F5CAB
MDKVFSIIVTFNGEKWIRTAISSLLMEGDSGVIVVDNGSSDSTVDIIKTEFPQIDLICLNKNLGFGCGNNIGIARAISLGADYVFLLNQDAFVAPGALSALSNYLLENLEYDVASPIHCSPDIHTLDKKTLRNYVVQYAPEYISDACLGSIKDSYSIRGINAAAWMVRVSAFKKVGGFDPLFFMYGEDDDLVNRMNYHGCRFVLLPSAKIIHFRESSSVLRKSYFLDLKLRAERIKSNLLIELKQPGLGYLYMAKYIVAKSFFKPFSDFILDLNVGGLFAHLIACFMLFVKIKVIRDHGRICAFGGPVFLEHGLGIRS